jgi:lactoylglutathione lyase
LKRSLLHEDYAAGMIATFGNVRLLVDDYDEALAFYRDVVGFSVKLEAGPDEAPVYAELDAGGGVISIYKRHLMKEVAGVSLRPPGDGAVIVLSTDEVDASYARLVGGGAVSVTDPHDQPVWLVRVAHVRDPAGNLIELSRPM